MTCRAELIARALNPGNWGALSSENRGRSELAAQFYDEMLFHGVTFADLDRGTGPLILASATDISTGARLAFMQYDFDFLCSDLNAVPLSRAAAASSAVPFVLTPMTLNTYGGTCKLAMPKQMAAFGEPETAPRPAARALKTHARTCRHTRMASTDRTSIPWMVVWPTTLACALRLRSCRPSRHEASWVSRRRSILIEATGVPIDHYSYEAVEQLKDTMARWQTIAAYSGFGDLTQESRSRARGARKGAGHRTSCHRCILPRPQGQGRS